MKLIWTRKNKLIAMLLCLIISVAIMPGKVARAVITGNDSPSTAYEITSLPFKSGVSNNGTKWFKFEAKKEMSLHIDIPCGPLYIYKEEELEKDSPQYLISLSSGGKSYKLEQGIYYINAYMHSSCEFNAKEIIEDSNENNDVWQRATQLALGEEKQFNISAQNDIDWYKITMPKKGTLRLSTEYSGSLNLDIYSSKDVTTALYSRNSILVSQGFKVEQGDYYIKLSNRENTSIWFETLNKIKVDFYEADIYEDNESPEQAKPMPLGKDVNINLQSEADEDWFKIEVGEQGATLRIDLSGPQYSYVRFDLYNSSRVTNQNASTIWSEYFGKPSRGNNNFYDYTRKKSIKLEKGVYYLKFKSNSLYNSYEYIYNNDMTVKFELVNDEYENNDTREKAYPITINSTQQIILDDYVDEDWFEISIDDPRILNLQVDMIEGESVNHNPSIYIYKGNDLNEFKHYYYTSKDKNVFLDKGKYYIKYVSKHDSGSNNNYRSKFSVINTFTPTGIQYNGTWDTSYELITGKQEEFVSAMNTEQWLKFTVDTEKELYFNTTGRMNFYTVENGVLKNYYGNVQSPSSWSKVFSPNTYYVKLWPNYEKDLQNGKIRFLMYDDTTELVPHVYHNTTSGDSTYPTLKFRSNHVLDQETLTKENIKMYRNKENVEIDFEFYNDTKTLVMYPTTRLNYETTYRVVLSKEIKSLETGYKMNADYEYSFTTGKKPTVTPPPEQVIEGRLLGHVNLPSELKRLGRAAEIIIKGNGITKYVYLNEGRTFDVPKIKEGEYEVRVKVPMMLDDVKTVTVKQGYDAYVELTPEIGDLNSDGIVDIFDISNVSKNYNKQSQ